MKRHIARVVVVLLIVGTIVLLERERSRPSDSTARSLPVEIRPAMESVAKARRYEQAKEISSPDGFINTSSITIGDLLGKNVILVDFWTYSCINCQRTIPYLNAWHEKYKNNGLVIIGIHTPEFEFEKRYDNVQQAVQTFGIRYPVVLDNDFSTWTAYRNRYWPRKYLIDIDGYIVYDHIGEGGYEDTERAIQNALHERLARLGMENGVPQDMARPSGVEVIDPSKPLSPEIYFGAWRNEYLGNGTPLVIGRQTLTAPSALRLNRVYLDGEWQIEEQYAKNSVAGAKIIFRYQAKNVYMVAHHAEGVTVRVLRDGLALVEDAGSDVSGGIMRVDDDRLYHIVADDAYGEHTLELQIEGAGLEAFTFTFG